jgi:putative peptide zinc metalloprotease protein
MSLINNLRLRPDLVIQPQDASCGTWVVKDPVALRFFLFGPDEHFILQHLNGTRSTEEILDEFARARAPKRMTATRLHTFLSALCRNGLTCSDIPGQSSLLLEREDSGRWRESVLSWTNLLAIRLPGVNPDAWLDRLYPAFRWCFSWWFLTCCALVWFVAVGLVVVEADALRAQWPRVEEFVSGHNLIWLVIALAATKIFHELAHALTCKHFGGRCHELGIMLLVFTPCLYCNVTDAWMLRNRWQRIAISAAGILMELQLAAMAAIIWRYTQPGPLNSICLNVIVVCSVGTLLFNGNPLLKYDGYYILSDLVRMPNLWQQSRSGLYRRLSELLLGRVRPADDEPPGRRRFLIAYAIASITYRFCLTLAILLFLYRLLHPSGFDLILLIVVASIVGQTAIAWATPLARWWADPTRTQRMRKVPLAILLTTLFLLLAAVFCIPLPCGVIAPAVLQPGRAQRVYVTTPGILVEATSVSDQVVEGQVLALLENADLRNEQLRIGGDLSRAQTRVKTLQVRQGDESGAAAQLQVAQEILADLTQQARLREEERRSLTLLAPTDGTVIPPLAAPRAASHGRQLPMWAGTPLDRENYGCTLDRGTLFCLVSDLGSCDAVVFVDETDLPYVRVGQQARLQLEYANADVVTGRVVEIAEINALATPAELASQHDVAVRRDDSGAPAPIRTTYQVRLALDTSDVPRLIGTRGVAQILVDPQTIVERIVRWVRRTISIDPPSAGA